MDANGYRHAEAPRRSAPRDHLQGWACRLGFDADTTPDGEPKEPPTTSCGPRHISTMIYPVAITPTGRAHIHLNQGTE